MSGGSYNYLCFREDAADLASSVNDLREMHERLAALPWAQIPAAETAFLLAAISVLDSYVRAASELREVWRAVEWWDSGDTSEESTREAVRKYEDSLGLPAAVPS